MLSLHSRGPHPLLLHPVLCALWFYFALGLSILSLCVQFALLFCFGLTYKRKKTQLPGIPLNKRKATTIPRPQRASDSWLNTDSVIGTSCPWLVNPTICTNKSLLPKRGAHSLFIHGFKLLACDILEDVFHSALQSRLVLLSRQTHLWKANQAICLSSDQEF